MMLCEEKFFNGETFAEQLEIAYDDFKDFVRARKIPCSQKMFTPGLVLWPNMMKYSNLLEYVFPISVTFPVLLWCMHCSWRLAGIHARLHTHASIRTHAYHLDTCTNAHTHTQHANAHAHLCCTRALTCTAMSPMCPAYASCVHTWVSASPSPSQVMKKDGQLLMTGKAYNNRCIAEWLHDAALRANQVSTDPRMPVACLLMTLALIFGVGMFETTFPGSLPVQFLCVFKCFSPIPFWRRVRYHLAKEWHHSIFWDHGKISPVLATGSARNSTCRHGVVV